MLTVKVPVVPRSGPGPPVQDRPLEEAGRTDGETSRIPCEGHPDQRAATVRPFAFPIVSNRNLGGAYLKARPQRYRSQFYAANVAAKAIRGPPLSRSIRDGAFCYGSRPALASNRASFPFLFLPQPSGHPPIASPRAVNDARERGLVRLSENLQWPTKC